MNLRSVDLNLLVALDALLSERHVTRAALRIGLSQPAMSNALGRLRHLFKDELLVRTAAGMQPTPRALELLGPARQVLRQIERVFTSEADFDPTRSERGFTIRMSDLLSFLLLPALLDQLQTAAPAISLDILHLSPVRTVEALERDEIDVAVSTGLAASGVIRSTILLSDRMVCVMRRGHPLAGQPLTLDGFLAQRHLKVSMSPTDVRFVDDVLEREHLGRDIALNVPHWLVVPHVLARTDLVSVMPRRLAVALAGRALIYRDLPFASQHFDWMLYWHRRQEGSRPNQWLRQQIAAVCGRFER